MHNTIVEWYGIWDGWGERMTNLPPIPSWEKPDIKVYESHSFPSLPPPLNIFSLPTPCLLCVVCGHVCTHGIVSIDSTRLDMTVIQAQID